MFLSLWTLEKSPQPPFQGGEAGFARRREFDNLFAKLHNEYNDLLAFHNVALSLATADNSVKRKNCPEVMRHDLQK